MDNKYCVGNVLAIEGNKIKVLMHENTNMFKYFFEGNIYNGVSINEYVGIIRGPYKIVAKVSKEYLSDKFKEATDHTYAMDRFERIVEVDVVGYFESDKFNYGIKYFPMIFNEVVLLSDKENEKIVNSFVKKKGPTDRSGGSIISDERNTESVGDLCVGVTLNDGIDVKLDLFNLFNTHIGIFGNTGSGKSNTLAKLYTELFNKDNLEIFTSSKFILLDFNGEYVGDSVFEKANKHVINLDTKNGKDKIIVSKEKFWSKEFLSVLFSATEKTQQPFIGNMLKFYQDKLRDICQEPNQQTEITKMILNVSFCHMVDGNNDREILNLFKRMVSLVVEDPNSELLKFLNFIHWHANRNMFYLEKLSENPCNKNESMYFDTKGEEVKKEYNDIINKECLSVISDFELLIFLMNAQLIYGLRYRHVQYDHINPLLSRVTSSSGYLEKTIEIGVPKYEKLTVISMRKCNLDAKQVLPMVIAQQLYDEHMDAPHNDTEISKTVHLIIDEAHNILSEKSPRESEQFKDYRLDVFEKMIKEGRKFGFYMTIASQRPHDISHTIISQLHNYFIHRLVNDLDLRMIANAVSDLDNISLSMLSKLGDGQCIISGTSFEFPTIVQISKLDKKHSPASESANLEKLWVKSTENDN